MNLTEKRNAARSHVFNAFMEANPEAVQVGKAEAAIPVVVDGEPMVVGITFTTKDTKGTAGTAKSAPRPPFMIEEAARAYQEKVAYEAEVARLEAEAKEKAEALKASK